MLQLVIYGLLAAGLAFGGMRVWNGFTGQYRVEGATEQMEKDKPILEAAQAGRKAAEERAGAAEAEAAKAVAAAATQSEAIEQANTVAKLAQEAARKQAVLYAQEVAKRDSRLAALRAAAGAPPKGGQSCEALLAATDRILRDSAVTRSAP